MWQDRGPLRASNPVGPVPAPQQGKKKGFWMDQISTGGGIGGALAGAGAGAAIGSVVPVVGTAVGGILGALVGGGLGSAGGEFAENVITKEEDLGKNVLQEGLIGGVTSLPIGAGLKLANAGLKAGTQGALGVGSKTAGELVQEAGVQTIGRRQLGNLVTTGRADQGALDAIARINTRGAKAAPGMAEEGASKFSLSGRLTDMGNRALASQYGTISKPVARSTNPTQTISELADMGITKPDEVERIAAAVTGSEGIINRAVLGAVGKSGGVNIDSMKRVFDDAVENYGLVDKDAQSLRKVFDAQMNRLRGGTRGSIATTVDPSEALAVMKNLEKRMADLTGRGGNYRMTTPERTDQANVLRLVRDELEDALYQGAGANANLAKVLTPQLRNELVSLNPGNKAWARYVDERVMGAQTVGDLRSSMAPFVRANQIIDEGDINAITFGGRAGNALTQNGIVGGIRDAIANVATGPAARVAGTALRTAGGRLPALPPQAVGQGIAGLTARQGIGRAVMPSEGSQAATDPTMTDALMQAQAEPQFTSTFGVQGPQQQAPQMGFSSQQLGQALMQAYAAGDAPAAQQLQAMYELALAMEEQGAGTELNANARASLATSANAVNTLDQLEALFNSAGGGSGRIAGSVANLGADLGFNDNVQAYNNLAASTTSQLAKAINGGGQVSDADAAAIISALPLVTDSPEVARIKFNDLRNRLMTAQQNTVAIGGGQPDVLSAIQAAGY